MDRNLPFLVAAYTAWFVVMTAYCVHLMRQVSSLRRELDELKSRLDARR